MVKKILSIDGGGIKGIFVASFLSSLEDSLGENISNYFDLIVGTSTGGIIAIALGLGFSAKETLSFYEKLGPNIFKGIPILKYVRWIILSKYNQNPLRKALSEKFGHRKLGESSKRLVIPSLNLENGEVHVYKTAHHPRFERDYKEIAVDVALATSSAPSFFPAHRSAKGIPLVDGGMWANNPVGFAVVEAIGVLNWAIDSIKVLSIGCTTTPLDIGIGRNLPLGLGYWGPKIVDVFMSGQSSASLGIAKLLIGSENIIRINPIVPKKRFCLDGLKEMDSLKGLGDSEARSAIPKLREIFFKAPAENFDPHHKL